MKNHSHPGEMIRVGILEPLNLTITKAAEVLGVRRATLSDLVNKKTALSLEMAIRLEKGFGPKATMLMRIQHKYDMENIPALAKKIRVKRYENLIDGMRLTA